MDVNDFIKLKKRFENADTDGKIDIYLTSEGLSKEQYIALLRVFPRAEIGKLEKAMELN